MKKLPTRKIVALALCAPLLATSLLPGAAHADPSQRAHIAQFVQAVKPWMKRARNGDRPSIDIQAVVSTDGRPVVIEQNSDINFAGVFQRGGGSTGIYQNGSVNYGYVRQFD